MPKYISENEQLLREEIRIKNKSYASELNAKLGRAPIAQIITFGCQQNEADSQIIAGELALYGYDIFYGESDELIPDLIILNTCAVREHAELKALSKTGNLKQKKKQNPELIIGIGGCMVQQEHRINAIKNSYPYVNFLFGTNCLARFPFIFNSVISEKKRVFYIEQDEELLPEGMPVCRPLKESASVSIMYGCNNFCTYCVVPHVRGREKSRAKADIIREIIGLIENGCKEITLLGQNVNSYGKDLEPKVSFADLCNEICALSGDFTVKFMTSHPKDVSDDLIKCIANNAKMAKHLHFPLQAGSDRVLTRMNRRYTLADYLAKVDKIRSTVPDMVLSSDIIVGFPGETEEDFQKTLEALKIIRYDFVYSFIYSPRPGTPAAEFDDQVSEEDKNSRMTRLLQLQTDIMADINARFVGKTVIATIEGISKKSDEMMTARTSTNKLIHISADNSLKSGDTVKIKITKAQSYQMYGELQEKEIKQ